MITAAATDKDRLVDDNLQARIEVRELIDAWILFRDGGEYDRLAELWHPDGFIITTWCEASAHDFGERSRRAWEAGVKVFHTVNGSHVEVDGDRAFALTKMQIIQRAPLNGVLVDVTCQGRFCDAFEKHDGRWSLLSRQAIYEGDRLAPVEVGARVEIDAEMLATFPEGYRYLGYLQTKVGLPVNKNLPGARGPETVELLARMRRWLAGGERALVRSAVAVT